MPVLTPPASTRSRRSIGSAAGAAGHLRLCGIALLAVAAGCQASTSTRAADRDAERELVPASERTLGGRRESVVLPATKAQPPQPEAGEGAEQIAPQTEPSRQAEEPRLLSLSEALQIASRTSRELLTQKESLYLEALSLVGTRHGFAPQLDAALSYLFADSDDAQGSTDVALSAGVSQILPQGGRLALTGSSAFSTDTYSSSLRLGLTQPLLRGSGRLVAWEPLTQAERSLVYAIRDFEQFRQGFSIDVARRFYDLVQQKQSVGNERRNLEKLEFTRRKAEALYSVGRGKELDVLRARRDELSSQNRFLQAEEDYQASVERFRIFLGLPPEELIDVRPEDPELVRVDYDVGSAVAVALVNRLDYLNRREQLEDTQRQLRIERDGLRPNLDLDLAYILGTGVEGEFLDQGLDQGSWSAGLRLEIPVDRLRERNAVRSAEISLARARRSLEEFRQELAVGVQNAFRELERREKSLEIQGQLIEDQERNVRVAELLFERGENDNRDVVEALQALVDAQNALIQEKVSYAISRLELIRDLGILFVDENGAWLEP